MNQNPSAFQEEFESLSEELQGSIVELVFRLAALERKNAELAKMVYARNPGVECTSVSPPEYLTRLKEEDGVPGTVFDEFGMVFYSPKGGH